MSLIADLWDGYVSLEGRKVDQRLDATAPAQEAWQNPPVYQQPQAQASQAVSTAGGFTTKQMMVGGGVVLALVGLVVVLR